MKLISIEGRFSRLFQVQATQPAYSHWNWLWGGWGVLCGVLAIIEQIPDIVNQVVAPISSIAFDLRGLQVIIVGLWIAWKQPWSPANIMDQRKGWMLNIICAILLIPAVGVLLLDPDPWGSVWYYLTLGTLALQIFWISRRGLVRLAAILLTASLVIHWLGVGGLNTDLRDVGYIFIYGLIFLIGGVLVKWWFGLIMALALPLLSTILSSLGVSAISPNWDAAFLYVLLLSAYAGIIGLYTRALESALTASDAKNVELNKAQGVLSQANEQLRSNEEQLRASEERYRVLTELMSDYIFKLDVSPAGDTTIAYLSENYTGITGRTMDQVRSLESWSSILHPDDLRLIMGLLHQIIQTGQSGELECRSVLKDGRHRWVHILARPVTDPSSGMVTEIIGSVKDITERTQVQKELEDNRRRLAFLLDKSPSVIYSSKASGNFGTTFMSANVTNQLGYQPEEFINDPGFWMEHIHPDDASQIFSGLEKLFAHDTHSHEYRFRHKNGRYLWMRDELTLVRAETGEPKEIIGAWTDITESKQAEAALRESRTMLKQILDTVPQSIFWKDKDFVYLGCNRVFAAAVGISAPEEIIGKTDFDLPWPRHEAEAYRTDDAYVISNQTPKRHILEPLQQADGARLWIDTTKLPLVNSHGEVCGVLGVYEDITERKRAEQALIARESQLNIIFNTTTDMQILMRVEPGNRLIAETANRSYLDAVKKLLPDLELDVRDKERSELLKSFGFPVEGIEQEMLMYLEAIQTKAPVHFVTQLLTPLGNTILQVTISPVVDRQGMCTHMLWLGRDITESKQAENALRESEARYRQLFNSINDAVMVYDLEAGKFVDCNEGVTHLLGYTLDEFISLQPADIVHPDFHQIMRVNQHRLNSGENTIIESLHQRKDGTTVQVEINSRLVTYQGARMILSVVRDITERQQAELALRESELKFRSIFNHSVDAIGVSKRGIHMTANMAYLRMFGYDAVDELVGKPVIDLIAPSHRLQILDNIRRRAAGENIPITYETRGIRRDGSEFDMEVHISTYELDGEQYTVPILRDITERKRTENALRENEAIFSSFLEHSPIYVFFKDKNIRTLRLSRNYEEMLGMPIQATIGKSMNELFPSPLAQSMVADDLRILKEGKRVDIIEELNGRVYETTKFPIFVDGQPEMLAGFTMDITERKQIENALTESQRRLSTALRATKLGVWEWDMRTSQAYWSDENYRLMGWHPGEVESKYENWAKAVHPDDLPDAEAKVTEAMNNRSELNIEFRVVWPDGSLHWINDIGSVLVDESGQTLGMYGIQMDITERKHMEELLFEEKERAEITLHSIGDGVITVDINELVEYLNPVAENLTGWRLEEATGQPLDRVFQIIEEDSRQPAISSVKRCLQDGRVIGLANHFILISRNGREYFIDDSAAPIRNRNGNMIGAVLVFQDVTEERRLSRKIAHDAMHDSLTGLVNRREFEKRLERALVSTKEQDISHILCYLDLDQFKIVNDTAGHAAGDELLKQLSSLLSGLFRQRDTFARLGGDEFGLLLENCQLDQALIIANEIKAKIRNYPFVWAGNGFHVGVSIGLVPITAEKESVNQLMSEADVACYSAKDLGRDRIYVYHKGDNETTQRHSEIIQAARMHDAIFQDRFRLYCQPIVQVAEESDGIHRYEILLRMADHDGRLIFPGAFIPSAERYGEMQAIDRWVIRETLLAMARHDTERMLININVSGSSLDDETLLEYVLEQLREFSIPPRHVCFEITETAAIRHLNAAQRFIRNFRAHGGKIALDDFGSGFSSFRYLKTLSVDYIKIDGGFVGDMLSNPGDLLMVDAITKIAHTLSIEVIAEHASNMATIERLREMGVDFAQGFGIGLPVTVEDAWKIKE